MEYLQTAIFIIIMTAMIFAFFKAFYKIGDFFSQIDKTSAKYGASETEKMARLKKEGAKIQQNASSKQTFDKEYWKERQKAYEEADKARKAEEQKKAEQKTENDAIPECLTVLGFTKIPDNKEDIRTRYKKLSKIYHPDAGGSEEEFQRLNKAWDSARTLFNLT